MNAREDPTRETNENEINVQIVGKLLFSSLIQNKRIARTRKFRAPSRGIKLRNLNCNIFP